MAITRLTRKFTDVVKEVEAHIATYYNVSASKLAAIRKRARNSPHSFPKSPLVDIDVMWIDYEVQRDVLYKHVISIMKKWDPRVCSPVSVCRQPNASKVDIYDGQHRAIAAAILGFKQLPCAIVVTTDKNFASFAFQTLNDTGVKRLTAGDLHRNALIRYKNNSREIRNVRAYTMQCQFDQAGIDLQDKCSRASATLRGDCDYFFSHFKYAQRGLEIDETGSTLLNVLVAIKSVFGQEEIDQGVFIGLVELQRLVRTNPTACNLPRNWMITLLKSLKTTFKDSHQIHNKAKKQWEYSHPGASWTAPTAMANFMRELHMYNGGKLNLPYHGSGSCVGIIDNNIAPGLLPVTAV